MRPTSCASSANSVDPVTVLGHSMGAYVALMAAEHAPELFHDVVLVDGGAPLPSVADDEVDAALDATLGPAIARLRTTWPDRVSYQTMWSQHPAFAGGLGIDLERNLLADLVEVDGGFRTGVNEAAVMIDGRDLLVDDDVRSLLASRSEPTTVLRAPNGLMGTPPPLIPDEIVAALPQHRWVTVPDTNHYTILLGPAGAAAVAEAVRTEVPRRLIGYRAGRLRRGRSALSTMSSTDPFSTSPTTIRNVTASSRATPLQSVTPSPWANVPAEISLPSASTTRPS